MAIAIRGGLGLGFDFGLGLGAGRGVERGRGRMGRVVDSEARSANQRN
jgi:hypothetical protein